MNNRKVGTDWEEKASAYLESLGMQILERNFRCRIGEIDLIGRHRGYLVFVEVKYRSGPGKGNAAEAVDYRKQRQICRVADFYRLRHGLGEDTPVRYDVVAVTGERMEWVENAFYHLAR